MSRRHERDLQDQPEIAHPISTEQLTERFCAEMIQNLKRNIPVR
jgi:hypothetical protein